MAATLTMPAGGMVNRKRKSTADSTAATVRTPNRPPWLIILGERGPDGEWRTTGEPLPNVAFDSEADAYAYAQKRNKQWNAKFDWADDPSLAWVAVRADQLGRLRSHKPVGESPPERRPVVAEAAVRLAPARGKRKRGEEDEQDDAEDDHDGNQEDQQQDEDTDKDDAEDDEDEAGQMMLALG